MIFAGVVSLLSVVTLRHSPAGAGRSAAALIATGASHVAVYNWTFLLGPSLMPALNALLLGTLMYRSRLVPRLLPVTGTHRRPAARRRRRPTLFGASGRSPPRHCSLALPVLRWELSLGVWLVVKGFRPSPITTGMAAARTPPVYQDATI